MKCAWPWNSVGRSRLEKWIWASLACRFYLKPRDWVQSSRESGLRRQEGWKFKSRDSVRWRSGKKLTKQDRWGRRETRMWWCSSGEMSNWPEGGAFPLGASRLIHTTLLILHSKRWFCTWTYRLSHIKLPSLVDQKWLCANPFHRAQTKKLPSMGHLAGSVGRAFDFPSQGCVCEPHIGQSLFKKKKERKKITKQWDIPFLSLLGGKKKFPFYVKEHSDFSFMVSPVPLLVICVTS